jgi:hypothetical protein
MLDALDGELLLMAEDARADLRHLQRITPGVRNLFGLVTTPNSELACGNIGEEYRGRTTNSSCTIAA